MRIYRSFEDFERAELHRLEGTVGEMLGGESGPLEIEFDTLPRARSNKDDDDEE